MRIHRLLLGLSVMALLVPQMALASITIKINPVGNPASTEYAIFEADREKYVLGNGTLGDAPDWMTYAEWGGSEGFEIVDLEEGETFTFQVKARNATADETDFSDPESIINPRTPRDTPENFITLKAANNVVNEQTFATITDTDDSEEESEAAFAGIIGGAIDQGLNAFLLTLAAFFVYYVIVFLVKQARIPTATASEHPLVVRVKTLAFVIMMVLGVKVVFSSMLLPTYANWSPPEEARFSADALLVSEGDIITYRILLDNNESPRFNVDVANAIPEGTTFVSGSLALENQLLTDNNDGDEGYFDSSSNVVNFELDSVTSDAQVRLYFSVKVD